MPVCGQLDQFCCSLESLPDEKADNWGSVLPQVCNIFNTRVSHLIWFSQFHASHKISNYNWPVNSMNGVTSHKNYYVLDGDPNVHGTCMCPVQDFALVMVKANWVRQKHIIWTENFQILKVGHLRVLIQVCCQFDIFCSKNPCRWVEVFAQWGKSQRRAAEQTQGMPAPSNAPMTLHPLAISQLFAAGQMHQLAQRQLRDHCTTLHCVRQTCPLGNILSRYK